MRQERDYSRDWQTGSIWLFLHKFHCESTQYIASGLTCSVYICSNRAKQLSTWCRRCFFFVCQKHTLRQLFLLCCVFGQWAINAGRDKVTWQGEKKTALNPELLCLEMFGDSWQALEVLWTYNHSKMWCSFHKIYVCRTADWCLLLLVHARRKAKIKHKWRRTFGVHLCLLTCLLVYK